MSIEDVQSRAQALPENGVPPEIIKLLPLDKLLDNIQIQKSATPVATPRNEEEAAANIVNTSYVFTYIVCAFSWHVFYVSSCIYVSSRSF